MKGQPICLTIGGLDPSGGAGIVADVRTFQALNCFPAAVCSSITFQNTTGVRGAEHLSGDTVLHQLEAVLDDYDIGAIKTGMLPSADAIRAVADTLQARFSGPVVVDPVIVSTSGHELIDAAALKALVEHLLPLASVVTPNLAEAEALAGQKISSDDEIAQAAERILAYGPQAVLIKGGHRIDQNAATAVDHLFTDGGSIVFTAPYVDCPPVHGTGCVLSAAIAANLSLGHELTEAIEISKRFVFRRIENAKRLGKGSLVLEI